MKFMLRLNEFAGAGDGRMPPLLEDHTASFIVRIWCEPEGCGVASNEWRGSIEHVPSGRRAFFRDLGAIGQFMKPHLEALGIDMTSRFWEFVSDSDSEPVAPPIRPA